MYLTILQFVEYHILLRRMFGSKVQEVTGELTIAMTTVII